MTELNHIAESYGLIVAAVFVLMMQAGFLAREAGLTRGKNSANVAAKGLTNIGLSYLLFWLIGFGLMFGVSNRGLGFYGISGFGIDFMTRLPAGIVEISESTGGHIAPFFLFQAMLCATAVAIATGSAAERIRFESVIVVTIVFVGLIYPVSGHWIWGGLDTGAPSGWLARRGFTDFAGATVIHSLAGWFALALAILVKPRLGIFNSVGRARRLPKSSPVLAALGTLWIWLGWLGLMGGRTLIIGSAIDLVLVNTMLAGAVGMVAVVPAALLVRGGHLDHEILLSGLLAGLVSASAAIHAISPQQVVIVAAVGAWLMLLCKQLLLSLRIDDAVGAIPIHLGAGIWATVAVALFGDPAILNTGLSISNQLMIQLLGIFAIGGWAFLATMICLNAVRLLFPLRITEEEEVLGLNLIEQGEMPDYSEFPGLGDLLSSR